MRSKKGPSVGRGAEVFEDAHANKGVSWRGLECPNGKRMSLESILNFGARWLSSPGPNTEFLSEAAASLRDLALRAPDIANELRRFADDLEQGVQRAARDERPRNNNAAD